MVVFKTSHNKHMLAKAQILSTKLQHVPDVGVNFSSLSAVVWAKKGTYNESFRRV